MFVLLQIGMLVAIVYFFHRQNIAYVTYMYVGLLCTFVLLNYFIIETVQWGMYGLGQTIWFMIIVCILAVVYYLIDYIALNMVQHKQIILDIRYMLRGTVPFLPFVTSMFIATLEEILFRYYVLSMEGYSTIVLLFIGSICFGLVHIKFSLYDIASKAVLGIVCGLLFILFNSVIFPIIFHWTYNFFTLKKRT